MIVVENGCDVLDVVVEYVDEFVEFDVILMDMEMFVMDGYIVVGVLKSNGLMILIIVLMVYVMSGDWEKCL